MSLSAGIDADRQADGLFLNCPRCGLSIGPRTKRRRVAHCPRCLSGSATVVELFASRLPSDRLYPDGHVPRAEPPVGDRTGRGR